MQFTKSLKCQLWVVEEIFYNHTIFSTSCYSYGDISEFVEGDFPYEGCTQIATSPFIPDLFCGDT